MIKDRQRVEEQVSQVYRQVDQAIAKVGMECAACGRCCHFDGSFILYASALEVHYLVSHAGPPPRSPSGGCPYQAGALCRARESRPLGCRTYFCDPARRAELEAIHGQALRSLKRICDEEGVPWRYAPLMRTLAERA